MITTIFIILLILALSLIIAGFYTKAPPVNLTGYLFLFILGLVLLTGGLQYKSGSSTTFNYSNTTLISQNTTDQYSNYDNEIIQGITLNHVLGFFISCLGALGWIITLTNLEAYKGGAL